MNENNNEIMDETVNNESTNGDGQVHSSFFEPPKNENVTANANNVEHKDYFKEVTDEEINNLSSSSPFQVKKEEEVKFNPKPLLMGIVFLVVLAVAYFGVTYLTSIKKDNYEGDTIDSSVAVVLENPSYSGYSMMEGTEGRVTLNRTDYTVHIDDIKAFSIAFDYREYVDIYAYIDASNGLSGYKVCRKDNKKEITYKDKTEFRKQIGLKDYGTYTEEVTIVKVSEAPESQCLFEEKENDVYICNIYVTVRFEDGHEEFDSITSTRKEGEPKIQIIAGEKRTISYQISDSLLGDKYDSFKLVK